MNNFIVYDFETSGRSSRFDQILQAGIIIYDQNYFVVTALLGVPVLFLIFYISKVAPIK